MIFKQVTFTILNFKAGSKMPFKIFKVQNKYSQERKSVSSGSRAKLMIIHSRLKLIPNRSLNLKRRLNSGNNKTSKSMPLMRRS